MLIQRVQKSDTAILKSIQRIYVDSIPASERKPDSWLTEMLECPDYALFAAMVSQEVVGFGNIFLPSNEAMGLLEYLAVDSAHRGRGIGRELISKILSHAQSRCILAEVESDLGIQEQKARQIFYRRLGFRRVVGLNYILPLNTSPPPMDLMALQPPDPLKRETLAHWLEIIYQQVYGQPISDLRLLSMMAQLNRFVRFD